MTIHMQEADAARNFSKVMEHVAAGDAVKLERDGSETALVLPLRSQREPHHVDDVLDRLRSRAREHGPAVMDEFFSEDIRHAHERLSERSERAEWP